MGEVSVDAREAMAREGIAALQFLVGTWEGDGQSFGAPVRGRLVVARELGDTFLVARETLWDAQGAVDHEDLVYYRYDPYARILKITQLAAPGWSQEIVGEIEPWGLRWYAGPEAPAVHLRRDGERGLVVEVWEPEAKAPATRLTYRRG